MPQNVQLMYGMHGQDLFWCADAVSYREWRKRQNLFGSVVFCYFQNLTQFQEQVYKTGQEILINFQHDQEILW
jgi:hypothetical protein